MTETGTTVSAAGDEWAALQALAEKATPGEWEVVENGSDNTFVGMKWHAHDEETGWWELDSTLLAPDDAAYIAAANPAAILRLLTAHAALVAERDALAAELAEYRAAQHLPPDERDRWADARTAYRELRVHHQQHHAEADTLRARADIAEAERDAERQRADGLRMLLDNLADYVRVEHGPAIPNMLFLGPLMRDVDFALKGAGHE